MTARTVAKVRESEPDTLIYTTHTVEGRPLQRIFHEPYRDRAAFEAHRELEHVKRFAARCDDLSVSFEVDFLNLRESGTTAEPFPGVEEIRPHLPGSPVR
ncbi:antibiotic biosynthesis monooxygenase [Streptosporangium sp. NPDC020145]|uniref:putative quinol monooxygenase n=1 Tax=Streptosporangium sp. NPDC020145 TaxID=3154694 RepID=UPI003447448A